METETFEKVIIKSEADYPKTEGSYFACRSGFLTVIDFKKDLPDKSWMREVRWYLRPVPPRGLTEEQIIGIIHKYLHAIIVGSFQKLVIYSEDMNDITSELLALQGEKEESNLRHNIDNAADNLVEPTKVMTEDEYLDKSILIDQYIWTKIQK